MSYICHVHDVIYIAKARHGILQILGSDHGPQYANKTIKQLAVRYRFRLVKSSPHYPQGNGLAEKNNTDSEEIDEVLRKNAYT